VPPPQWLGASAPAAWRPATPPRTAGARTCTWAATVVVQQMCTEQNAQEPARGCGLLRDWSARTLLYTHMHTQPHTRAHRHTHARTHTRTQAHTHACSQIHTHAPTCPCGQMPCSAAAAPSAAGTAHLLAPWGCLLLVPQLLLQSLLLVLVLVLVLVPERMLMLVLVLVLTPVQQARPPLRCGAAAPSPPASRQRRAGAAGGWKVRMRVKKLLGIEIGNLKVKVRKRVS